MPDTPKKPDMTVKNNPASDHEKDNTTGRLFIILNVVLIGLLIIYLFIFGIDSY